MLRILKHFKTRLVKIIKVVLQNVDYSKNGNFGVISLVASNYNEVSTKEDSIEFKSLKLDNFLKLENVTLLK